MQHLKIKVYDYNEVVACDAIQIKLDYLKVITCHNLFFLKAENAKFTDGEVEKPLKEGIYFLKKKDTFYEIMIYVYKMSCEHFEFYENQLVFIGNHPKANVIPDVECIQNLVTLSTQTFLRVPECFSNRVASRIIRLTVT